MAYFRPFFGLLKTAIFGRPGPGAEIPDFQNFRKFPRAGSQGKNRVSGDPANPRNEIFFF